MRVNAGCGRAAGVRNATQTLLERRLDLVKKLVHALLQPLVLEYQRIAHHDAGHAWILLGKLHQHDNDLGRLTGATLGVGREFSRVGCALTLNNLVDQRENGLFNEIDQAFEHLGFAGKVTIQRGLAHVQTRRQCGRRNALCAGVLQHGRQRLQYLHASLAGPGPLAHNRCDHRACRGGLWSGCRGRFEVGHGAPGEMIISFSHRGAKGFRGGSAAYAEHP